METDGYHIVGEPIPENHPEIFELRLNKYATKINPIDFGVQDDPIDPLQYFITSGDAVQKARVLHRDMVRMSQRHTNEELRSALDAAIELCSKLHDDLVAAKGTNIFLETEWENHRLLCIPKNPRRL